MKRILFMVLRNLFFVPYGWFKLCWYASHVDRYTEEERYKLLQQVDHRAIRGGNLIIDAHGVENIPKKNGFMFFPNHQGLYDVLAILDVCPKPFSVVAKKEIANIQFLKFFLILLMKLERVMVKKQKLLQEKTMILLFVTMVEVFQQILITMKVNITGSFYFVNCTLVVNMITIVAIIMNIAQV